MKHTLKIGANMDPAAFTIKTEGEGEVEGIIDFLKEIISHPDWRPGQNILLDHRDLEIDKITVTGIDQVSRFFKSINTELGNGKIALVMKRDIDFGIARAWEILTGTDVGISIRVFHKLEDGINWLNRVVVRRPPVLQRLGKPGTTP